MPAHALGANDRIRVGFIGIGDRGSELLNQLRACPNTEVVAFCDVYTKRLEKAQSVVPGAATYADYRRLLEDKSIDAVVIATPPASSRRAFLRMRSTRASTSIRKRPWRSRWITPSECARRFARMRGKHVVQVGPSSLLLRAHDGCAAVPDRSGADGKDHRDRHADASQHAARQAAMVAAGAADAGCESRKCRCGSPSWARLPRAISMRNRFVHWRYFWDYSGGNVYENMSQQLASGTRLWICRFPSPRRWTAASICGRTAAKFPTR